MARTWGELKAWAEETGVDDDTPLCIGRMSIQGGMEYYEHPGPDVDGQVMDVRQVPVPPGHEPQTWRDERVMVIYGGWF